MTQSDYKDKKGRTDTIEQFYDNNRYNNFENQETFKFKKPEDQNEAIQKKSGDVAKQTVRLCANMEAISAGNQPNIQWLSYWIYYYSEFYGVERIFVVA